MKKNKLLFAPAVTAAIFILSSCSKEDLSLPTDQANISKTEDAGYVYLESNNAESNTILIYKQHTDGSLEYTANVETGGKGTGTELGSQGDRKSTRLNSSHVALSR